MTIQLQEQATFIQAFLNAVDQDLVDVGTPRIANWQLMKLASELTQGCKFCGVVDVPLELVHLVSPLVGGPSSLENLLAACSQCAVRAKRMDWLVWRGKTKTLAPALAAQRLKVLAVSDNHLLRNRDEARTKPYLLRKLEARWQHPRFVVRACLSVQGGLLAFQKRAPLPEGIVLLVRLHGGSPVVGATRIFTIPRERFLDLIWLLLEHGARVRRMEVEGYPDPTPPDDGASRWHETFNSVNDIVRRRPKVKPEAFMRPRAWHEKPMDPRTRLHLAGLIALKTNQPLDQEWLAKHREGDEAFIYDERARTIAPGSAARCGNGLRRGARPHGCPAPAIWQLVSQKGGRS